MAGRFAVDRLASLLLVVALHMAAVYGLWAHRLIPTPFAAATLFVNFIVPPAPEEVEQPKRTRPPKLQPREKPKLRQLVAETPVIAPTDFVAPPPPEPAPVIEALPLPLPAGPVAMSSELSVACPERSAPPYPAQSRRLGETGIVVLRVELSENGHVAVAKVQSSSGYVRLDEAALATVRTWRCTPPTRNGQPLRAVALQPFNFVLQ